MSRSRSTALAALAIALAVTLALALSGCITVQVQQAASSSDAASASAAGAAGDASSGADVASSQGAAETGSSAVGGTASGVASSESATETKAAGMQTIGNNAVGHMQVPSTWTDRTSDLDPNMVGSYEIVYFVDPGSEYTSAAFAHFAFAKSVEMRSYPASYTEVAQGIIGQYESDTATYAETTHQETQFNGMKAVIVTTLIPDDGQQVCAIVVDRDGSGHSAVALILNCGASQQAAEEVLSYAATWAAK